MFEKKLHTSYDQLCNSQIVRKGKVLFLRISSKNISTCIIVFFDNKTQSNYKNPQERFSILDCLPAKRGFFRNDRKSSCQIHEVFNPRMSRIYYINARYGHCALSVERPVILQQTPTKHASNSLILQLLVTSALQYLSHQNKYVLYNRIVGHGLFLQLSIAL